MLGDFRFAGGIAIRSRDTDQMHELSDLVMMSGDRFIAVGDAGTRLDARLLLDAAGRLTGVTNAVLTPLIGLDGAPVRGDDRDAEGMALLPNGDLLVSFEGNHRVWRYPKTGDRALPAAWPRVSFPINEGMEAITEHPDAGDDAYLVGAEGTGETWSCRVSGGCVKDRTVDKPTEFGLVAMTSLPGGLIAYLLRAYDPIQLSRITLKIMRGGTVVSRMDLAPPLTVDNFEGLASWAGTDGRRRFYLISDDNDRSSQRTLLFAFDWQMPTVNKQ